MADDEDYYPCSLSSDLDLHDDDEAIDCYDDDDAVAFVESDRGRDRGESLERSAASVRDSPSFFEICSFGGELDHFL